LQWSATASTTRPHSPKPRSASPSEPTPTSRWRPPTSSWCATTRPDVGYALRIARAVRGKIKQNLFFAAIYNLLAIPLAAGAPYTSLGLRLPPEWAAVLMSASTIIVTFNALLIRRIKPRPTAA
jgi:hypothetical protein